MTYRPDVGQSATNTSSYAYDGNGQLETVQISDGRARTVSFRHDHHGQIIAREEQDNRTGGDPHEYWYRFGGRQLGYVGNNGTLETDHITSIDNRTRTTNGDGAFRFRNDNEAPVWDFDHGYSPINSYDQGSAGGAYTVRAGDTLQGIAAGLWGDGALWYKLAEANGMTGGAALYEGQPLRVPSGVFRSANNAATFQPYNPGEAVGDTSPTTPQPPKDGNNCGVFGR